MVEHGRGIVFYSRIHAHTHTRTLTAASRRERHLSVAGPRLARPAPSCALVAGRRGPSSPPPPPPHYYSLRTRARTLVSTVRINKQRPPPVHRTNPPNPGITHAVRVSNRTTRTAVTERQAHAICQVVVTVFVARPLDDPERRRACLSSTNNCLCAARNRVDTRDPLAIRDLQRRNRHRHHRRRHRETDARVIITASS